jgi:segregation and condensation protein B
VDNNSARSSPSIRTISEPVGCLLDKKFITTAGRKEVLGRPILYKTTREFLVHFGLKDLSELPSMEEFEELIKNQAAAEEEIPEEV